MSNPGGLHLPGPDPGEIEPGIITVCLLGASLAYLMPFRPHNSPLKADTIIFSSTDRENNLGEVRSLAKFSELEIDYQANRPEPTLLATNFQVTGEEINIQEQMVLQRV